MSATHWIPACAGMTSVLCLIFFSIIELCALNIEYFAKLLFIAVSEQEIKYNDLDARSAGNVVYKRYMNCRHRVADKLLYLIFPSGQIVVHLILCIARFTIFI